MTLRLYLWGVRLSALMALAGWMMVVLNFDPRGGVAVQVLFYLTAFFALAGSAILFLMWMKRLIMGPDEAMSHLGASFRQGVLLAALAVTLLFLQQFRVLVWWDGLLVVAGVFLVELYFLTR